MNRGQAAPILMGVVLLVLAAVFAPQIQDRLVYFQRDLSPQVTTFTEECMRLVGEEAIERVELQGGYATPTDDPGYVPIQNYVVHFGYVRGKNLLPSRAQIAQQISTYLDVNLGSCLNSYAELDALTPASISAGKASTLTTILDDRVQVLVTLPVEVRFEDRVQVIDTFAQTFNIPLGALHTIAEEAVRILDRTPGMVDVVSFAQLSLPAQYGPLDDRRGLITVQSDIPSRYGTHSFLFVVDYGENTPPITSPITPIRISLGDPVDTFAYAIDVDGDDLSWFDNATDWDIEPLTGRIQFTPHYRGTFVYTVFAKDERGLVNDEEFRVEVI